MKRVVVSLVGSGCLLVATMAMGQSSILVAQKTPDSLKAKHPKTVERICLDWPLDFIDDETVFFLCDDWPNFTNCDDDPEAAYEYVPPTPNYPCDCGITLPSSDPLSCQQFYLKGKKFNGLFALKEANTDLTLKVTEHLVQKKDGTIGVASAQVLYKEPQVPYKVCRYTYINANLPTSSEGDDTMSLKGILYHIQVRNPPGYSKPKKNFYLALECEDSDKTKNAKPLDFDIVRQDQGTAPPYFAFKSKELYGEGEKRGPLLMLTHTPVEP